MGQSTSTTSHQLGHIIIMNPLELPNCQEFAFWHTANMVNDWTLLWREYHHAPMTHPLECVQVIKVHRRGLPGLLLLHGYLLDFISSKAMSILANTLLSTRPSS